MTENINTEYESWLKFLIRNGEDRYISYKKLLEDAFKQKDLLPDWYKEMLRENKNQEESQLKKHVEELTNFRQELNPPFCYE